MIWENNYYKKNTVTKKSLHYELCDFLDNLQDMTTVLANLTEEQQEHPCVLVSLKLCTAWRLKNYKKFFELYKNAPMMSGYLLDWFVERERKEALKSVVKAYVTFFVKLICVTIYELIMSYISDNCRYFGKSNDLRVVISNSSRADGSYFKVSLI